MVPDHQANVNAPGVDMKLKKPPESPVGPQTAQSAEHRCVVRIKGGMNMTIMCIPVMDNLGVSSPISQHFGKTPYFAMITMEDNEIKDLRIVESLGKHVGGTMTPAEAVANTKANVLICGNLGSKAIQMLGQMGIIVYVGASGTVESALEQWKSGFLNLADDSVGCRGGV